MNDNQKINMHNASLLTFSRSSNSNHRRDSYAKHRSIKLIENTDFLEIVDNECENEYFYHGDLEQYDIELKCVGREYKNSNINWREYYIGTIVVPIRIEFDKLYHIRNQKKKPTYHVVGFLCVDSLSKEAFTKKQETYNIDVMYSFADMFYVLLGQYRHYMRGFQNKEQ